MAWPPACPLSLLLRWLAWLQGALKKCISLAVDLEDSNLLSQLLLSR